MRPGEETRGRPADPRQHAPRDLLDRDPGDPARRRLHLRLRGAERHREGARRRARRAASQASSSRGRSTTRRPDGRRSSRTSSTCRRTSRCASHPVQGRAARLLGAGLPREDRRRARDRHETARDAHEARHLPGRLRRAVRPRPLRRCARPRTSSRRGAFDRWLATAGAGAPAAPAAAAGAARSEPRTARRSSPGDGGCGACHTLADAGHDRHDRPGPRQSPHGQERGPDPHVDRRPERGDHRRASQANIMPPNFERRSGRSSWTRS